MTKQIEGKVISLFISHREQKKRVQKSSIIIDSKGILEDKFYHTDLQRSILITSIDSYTLMKKHNIQTSYGILGENILIDYNPYHLLSGTRMRIGNTLLEISQNCTICNHLSAIDESLPDLLKKDRGIFAKVIKGGVIKEGDSISLEEV